LVFSFYFFSPRRATFNAGSVMKNKLYTVRTTYETFRLSRNKP